MPLIIREKEIPNFKTYFTIGESSEILQCPTSAIRFWEDEGLIKANKPGRSGGALNGRRYNYQGLRLLVEIKELLHEHGLTVEAVRQAIEGKYNKSLLAFFRHKQRLMKAHSKAKIPGLEM